MSFKIKLTLNGKPSLRNSSHGHWATVERDRKKWHKAVDDAILFKPKEPLKLCRLKCVRYSSNKCDYDNLVYSFKPIVDGLVKSGIIIDDDLFTIVERSYFWCKTKRDNPFVTIEVEELLDNSTLPQNL